MHFIFGGAYNGKTAYVKQLKPDARLYTAYIPAVTEVKKGDAVIIRHIEQCICFQQDEKAEAARIVTALIALSQQCELHIIGNDISRGIVPIDKKARFQRDCAGRLYQLLMHEATYVTQIWYGIPQSLKGV